jgi:hypothetical protein
MTDAGVAGEPPVSSVRALMRPARVASDASLFIVAASSVALVGVVLRLAQLGNRALSFDEGYTVASAQRSFFEMLAVFRFEANGMLYAIVLWPLLRISESEAMVRAPAVVAGILTIPAVYWTGRMLVGRRAALLGMAVAAVSPALVGWSSYGRSYAFATLFATVSFGCVARATDRTSRPGSWRALYVLATLAMAYSSALALVLLPVHALAVWLRERGARGLRVWLGPILGLAFGLVPLVVMLYVASTYHDPLAWLWKPDRDLIRIVVGEVAAGPTFSGGERPGFAAAIGAVVIAILVATIILPRARLRMPDRGLQVVVGWALLPPIVLLLASEVRPVLWGRYLGIVVPALALLVGVALARLPKLVLLVYGAGLIALMVAASATPREPSVDFRTLGSWVETHRQADEPLVLYPVEQLAPLSYYARTLRVDGVMPVEEWGDTPVPQLVLGYRREIDWGDSPLGPPTASDLARLSARTGSFSIVAYPNLADDIPVAWARTRGCEVEFSNFDGLVTLSVRACRKAQSLTGQGSGRRDAGHTGPA